jgi:hypothetical protein
MSTSTNRRPHFALPLPNGDRIVSLSAELCARVVVLQFGSHS